MPKAFNDLDQSVGLYALSEEQKINNIEYGMKE